MELVKYKRTSKQQLVSKLQNSEESANELRSQLAQVSNERDELLNKTNAYEKEISSLRQQQNDITDERDALTNRGEKLMQRIDTLEQENKELDTSFKNAVQAKCEVLARVTEVESKETASALREKDLERERVFANARIQSLADEAHSLQYEITNSRQEFNSEISALQSHLSHKTQELSLAQRKCSQYQMRIEGLNNFLEEQTEKMRFETDRCINIAESQMKEVETKDKVIEMLNKDIEMYRNSQNELVAAIDKHKQMIVDKSKEFDEKETVLKAALNEKESEMQSLVGDVSRLESQMKCKEFTVTNLNLQICFLLKENQCLRIGECNEEAALRASASRVAESANGIPSTLVTFNSIQKLMQRNMQLLGMICKLIEQTEEHEKLKMEFDSAGYQEKLEAYEKNFKNLQDSINKKNELILMYIRRCDYLKAILAINKNVRESVSDSEHGADEAGTVKETSNVSEPSRLKRRRESSDDESEELEKMRRKYKTSIEMYQCYVKKKIDSDKIMLAEAEATRAKIRELTANNYRLQAEISFHESQAQIQLNDIEDLKKKMQAMEEFYKQNENHKLVEYEHNATVMHEEIQKVLRKKAKLEFEFKNVHQENSWLKQSVAQLEAERGSVLSTMHSQKGLRNNLEMLKNSIEGQFSKILERAESRLDDALGECVALRRSLQEKEKTFENMIKDIKVEKEKATERLQSEQQEVEKLRSELSLAREAVKAKAEDTDELDKQLKETVSPQRCDNSVFITNTESRDLELKLQKTDPEIEASCAESQSAEDTFGGY